MQNVGIIGYRSWIGQALADQIVSATRHRVVYLDKRDASTWDSSNWLALFIIPGKLDSTPEEMEIERKLVHDVAGSLSTCQRQILLSSQSVFAAEYPPADEVSEYAQHKLRVEYAFYEAMAARRMHPGQERVRPIAVRPGAIFGPGQDINAPMLIPQIAREGVEASLRNPEQVTKFVSVTDLTKFLVDLIEKDPPGPPWRAPYVDIPGQFEATPGAILDLWKTFVGMRSR